MNIIIKVWFENNKIFIKTNNDEVLSNPLEWFPRLFNASESERNDFEISHFGVHWDKINEDLCLEGFYHFNPKKQLH